MWKEIYRSEKRPVKETFTCEKRPVKETYTFVASCATTAHSQIYGAWLFRMWDTTHSYVRHDSFVCVTWLIHMCDMTHSYVWHDSFICVTRLIHMWHDSFKRVTWLIHMCDPTHSYVRKDSSIWVTGKNESLPSRHEFHCIRQKRPVKEIKRDLNTRKWVIAPQTLIRVWRAITHFPLL